MRSPTTDVIIVSPTTEPNACDTVSIATKRTIDIIDNIDRFAIMLSHLAGRRSAAEPPEAARTNKNALSMSSRARDPINNRFNKHFASALNGHIYWLSSSSSSSSRRLLLSISYGLGVVFHVIIKFSIAQVSCERVCIFVAFVGADTQETFVQAHKCSSHATDARLERVRLACERAREIESSTALLRVSGTNIRSARTQYCSPQALVVDKADALYCCLWLQAAPHQIECSL